MDNCVLFQRAIRRGDVVSGGSAPIWYTLAQLMVIELLSWGFELDECGF